ncbi:SRSF6-like protein [Mya arenaria]|uniref:SRSF6-like protein n=1 Tax=Mya arenaria TaxID=6604 RepID=A0ABY7FMT3_MYAAR|nr:SRSF6-like protein [Mya arenaria]
MADKVMRSLVMAVARGKYNLSHDFPLTTQARRFLEYSNVISKRLNSKIYVRLAVVFVRSRKEEQWGQEYTLGIYHITLENVMWNGYGKLRDVMLKNGYGFVEFEDNRDADDAVYELNGKELCGERISIEHARGTPRGSDRYNDFPPPRRGGGGGRDRYGPPTRTDNRLIVENLSSRVSWQPCSLPHKGMLNERPDSGRLPRDQGQGHMLRTIPSTTRTPITHNLAIKEHTHEHVACEVLDLSEMVELNASQIVEFMSYNDLRRAIDKLDGTEINSRRRHDLDPVPEVAVVHAPADIGHDPAPGHAGEGLAPNLSPDRAPNPSQGHAPGGQGHTHDQGRAAGAGQKVCQRASLRVAANQEVNRAVNRAASHAQRVQKRKEKSQNHRRRRKRWLNLKKISRNRCHTTRLVQGFVCRGVVCLEEIIVVTYVATRCIRQVTLSSIILQVYCVEVFFLSDLILNSLLTVVVLITF